MNIVGTYCNLINNARIPFCGQSKTPSLRSESRMSYDTFVKNNESIPSNEEEGDLTIDSFTGLRDKTSLLRRIEEKKIEASNNGKKLGIAMFDMDNFKSVNELLGYETGDLFIKTISENIKQVADENKLGSYRFGGEEFVILFANHSPSEMKKVCAQIQEKLNNNPILSSYSEEYMNIAENKLQQLQDQAIYLKAVNENRIKLKQLLELSKQDEMLMYSDTFKNMLRNSEQSLVLYMSGILRNSIKNEKNIKIREFLTDCFDKLTNGSEEEKEKVMFSDRLNEYLSANHDNTAEIYRLKTWMCQHKKNGFSITCGILQVPPDKYKDESSMDLIDRVGEVLKAGKHTEKGGIYTEKLD